MSPVWLFSVILVLCSFALIMLGVASYLKVRRKAVLRFLLMNVAAAVYVFGYAMEFSRGTPGGIEFWSRIQYIGQPFVASLLLMFVLYYVESDRRIPIVLDILPFLLPATAMVMRQTNHVHGLYYANVEYVHRTHRLVMAAEPAVWYWVLAIYDLLCLFLAFILIARYLVLSPRAHRLQATLLAVGCFLPVIPNIMYITGVPMGGLDINPIVLVLVSLLFYVAVLRNHHLTLAPVGRDWLVETMKDAVIVLDMNECIADANPSARRAFGNIDRDPVGMPLAEAFPALRDSLDHGMRVSERGRVWELSRTVLPANRGPEEGVLIVARDVTEREMLVEKLARMAREDTLTGLLNRHSWDASVATEMMTLARYGRFGSVIYLDLDHFKQVNDTLGHAAGDALLINMARVLKSSVRRPDLVGRYGGEEFVLFLPESSPVDAFEVAERLRVELKEAMSSEKSVVSSVTGSFGVAGAKITEDTDLEALVSMADEAMYVSKRKGRDRVTMHSDCLDSVG